MSDIQQILTYTTEVIAFSFTALLLVDFVSGLIATWNSRPPAPEVESDPVSLPADAAQRELEKYIAAQADEAAPEPETDLIALSIELPPQPAALEVANQPERDLSQLGIRELKRLASSAKIKRYNVMTKQELIAALGAA
jgi:hypothetical protein